MNESCCRFSLAWNLLRISITNPLPPLSCSPPYHVIMLPPPLIMLHAVPAHSDSRHFTARGTRQAVFIVWDRTPFLKVAMRQPHVADPQKKVEGAVWPLRGIGSQLANEKHFFFRTIVLLAFHVWGWVRVATTLQAIRRAATI